jgi:hypothetical protein
MRRVASRLQLALRDAIAAALEAAAISDVASDTHEYRYSEVYPRLVQDAEAGTLPDDPGAWLRQQFKSELLNIGPQTTAKRCVLERATQLIAAACLGPPEIAGMLSCVRVPKRVNAAGISQLGARCLTVAMHHQSETAIDAQWEPYKQIFFEAGEAHRKLRKLMPLLIDVSKRSGIYCASVIMKGSSASS